MFRKKSKRKFLHEEPVLIVDNKYESEYFQVSDFPSKLHAGKNMFRLKGNSDLLEKNSVVEIEVMPENGTEPIFNYINNYSDNSNRRLISIYVYPEDITGLARITIRGTARKRPGGRSVSPNWKYRPNVRWEREVYVDPSQPNTSPIIFPNQPRITINENVKPYLSESYAEDLALNTLVTDEAHFELAFTPSYTVGGGRSTTNSGYGYSVPSQTLITSNDIHFSASMLGGTITFANPTASMLPALPSSYNIPNLKQNGSSNTTDYTASIVQVINSSTIKVSPAYSFEYTYTSGGTAVSRNGGYSAPPQSHYATSAATAFSQSFCSMSWAGTPTLYTENNYNLHSYANIILANIDPMVGDVYRCKTSMRSHGMQTWDILADEIIEGRELLSDPSNIFRIARMGEFDGQPVIDAYWSASIVSEDASFSPAGPILKADSEALMYGMILSGSLALSGSSTRDLDYVKVNAKTPIEVFRNCEYQIAFKARAYAEEDDDRKSNDLGIPELKVYISGSGVDYDPIGSAELGRRMDSGELKAPTPPTNTTNVNQYTSGYALAATQYAGVNRSSTVATATPTTDGNIPDITANSAVSYDSDYVSYDFIASHDGFVAPVLEVKFGKWIVSDVSIKATSEDGFTPNHTIIEARVPQYQQDDILDFKFEFYDYNGVRANLIMVTESVSFEGGNNYINGEGYLGEGIVFDGII